LEKKNASSELNQVTLLLRRWKDGDRESLAELMPLVEGELRETAKRYMRSERRGETAKTGYEFQHVSGDQRIA
jgi:hypothetical protein